MAEETLFKIKKVKLDNIFLESRHLEGQKIVAVLSENEAGTHSERFMRLIAPAERMWHYARIRINRRSFTVLVITESKTHQEQN